MAKISANYEVVYIIDPAQGEEAVAATVAKFQSLAEQNATDVVVDEWGKRRLAYAIDYKTEGYYVLMSFTSGPDFPKELDRILGITEGIMRSMIVCKGAYGSTAMLHKIFIMGRLTRDPELRRTQSGTPVTSFSLAVDRDYKTQSGEKETDFIDVVAWRATAEFVAKYFTKGRMAGRGPAPDPRLAGQGGQQPPQRRGRGRQCLLRRLPPRQRRQQRRQLRQQQLRRQ